MIADRRGWKPILTAAACAIGVATLGGLVTDIGPWYHALKKPDWQPPDWLFGPAWTLIFALAAMAGVLAWRSRPNLRRWALIVGVFAANGVLNIVWSACFFGLHRPDWALAEVAALWLSIVALIVVLAPHSKLASLLIVPYLVWVSFAAFLNWTIVRLNYPFA
jgi:tryptophan-rich sensory protein